MLDHLVGGIPRPVREFEHVAKRNPRKTLNDELEIRKTGLTESIPSSKFPGPRMRISVIIPTLNEADWIVETLKSVHAQPGPFEVIVADGGSSDATIELARGGARVIPSPERGRGVQMNRGAREASGDVLLFLHADTLLPPDAFSAIRTAVDEEGAEGGTFRLRFDRSGLLLRMYSWCTRLPIPQICFGDRGLFVQKEVFSALDGYPETPIFEDLELVRALSERGRFAFLEQTVTTSARRFERNGHLRQQLTNLYLWLNYMGGTDPAEVADRYSYAE